MFMDICIIINKFSQMNESTIDISLLFFFALFILFVFYILSMKELILMAPKYSSPNVFLNCYHLPIDYELSFAISSSEKLPFSIR